MESFLTPFKESFIFKILLAIVLFFYSLMSLGQVHKTSDVFKTLKSKDSILFESAFDTCELEKLESIIAENFEFYHDIVGIKNRDGFIAGIKNNLCSNPGVNRRQLVKNSLTVFELKNNSKLYGAIQKGKHTFQQKTDSKMKTVGIADFTHVWILENSHWKLKRVLSYNHLPFTE